MIYHNHTNQSDIWDLKDDGYSEFLEELPAYYKNSDNENPQVFFCSSKYDIPLDRDPGEADKLEDSETRDNKPLTYLTPDGTKYQKDYSQVTDKNGVKIERVIIKLFETQRLSLDQVKKEAEIVEAKFTSEGYSKPFRYYHYGQGEFEDNH